MKRDFIKYSSIFFLVAVILAGGNSIYAGVETTVEEIMANKDSYEGKEVSISGTVSGPRFKASKSGKPYMTFPLLGDSGGRINIFVWGNMKLKRGQKVRVTGIYRKSVEMGKYSFRDMIEAGEFKTD